MTDQPEQTLASTLEQYGIELPEEMVEQLDRYRTVLWQWNEKLNLTRHADFEKFVTRDVVDSLELASLLESGETVLDVGTGGGVPGVIIAIVRPDVQVTLCESVGKRADAVAAIVTEAGLGIEVVHGRAEELLDTRAFDVVLARAVASLAKILRWMEPNWPRIGRLLLTKGTKWVGERGEARHHGLLRKLDLRKAATYPTPGTEAENVVLMVRLKDRE